MGDVDRGRHGDHDDVGFGQVGRLGRVVSMLGGADFLIRQFARLLAIKVEYLYYLAGELPADIKGQEVDEATVVAAYEAFRRKLKAAR